MAVPKFYEFFQPILECLKNNQGFSLKEFAEFSISYFKLTNEEMLETTSSGKHTKVYDRCSWAKTYLSKAGLIEGSAKTGFSITKLGLEALNSGKKIDVNYLKQFDSFLEFQQIDKSEINKENDKTNIILDETPNETFEESFKEINKKLQSDLLAEVMKLSPIAFEHFVLALLRSMGYGVDENSIQTTSSTRDNGIDGIILQDKLGFDKIYVQTKQYSDTPVGRPAIQEFVGAIHRLGNKGLFVTTSKFTKDAVEYAKDNNIILLDGDKLTKYMIEYNFGVSVKQTFEIKEIDSDLFDDYLVKGIK